NRITDITMTLYNPTNIPVAINYEGLDYRIEPFGSLEVSDRLGAHWAENIHQFVIMKADKKAPVESKTSVDKANDKKVEIAEEEQSKLTETEVQEVVPEVPTDPITKKAVAKK